MDSTGDVTRYIERMAKELKLLAAEARLEFLAYMLAMVEDEAREAAAREPSSSSG